MKIFAAKCFAHSGSPISLAEGNQIKAELSAIQSQVSSGLVIGNPALMFHLTSHTLTAPPRHRQIHQKNHRKPLMSPLNHGQMSGRNFQLFLRRNVVRFAAISSKQKDIFKKY